MKITKNTPPVVQPPSTYTAEFTQAEYDALMMVAGYNNSVVGAVRDAGASYTEQQFKNAQHVLGSMYDSLRLAK